MVASERILANISFPFYLSILHNFQESLNNITIDMKIDTSRGQSTSPSSNSSGASSAHSNVSFTTYTEHVQALANNPSWA